MNITEEELRDYFSYQNFNQGEKDYRAGKVINVSVENETSNGVELKSSVEGTNKKVYNQHIFIDNSMNFMEGDFKCDCKAINDCEHIISCSLFYINNIKNQKSLTNIDIWIGKVIDSSKILINKIENIEETLNQNFLHYRLFDINSFYSDISFYQTKVIKSGKISRGQKIDIDKLLYYTDYDNLINPEDVAIINTYKELISVSKTEKKNKIFGSLGYKLIHQLLKTQRCFYKNYKNPLSLSLENKSINFFWKEVDKFSFILTSNLESHFHIIPTKPLLIIDGINLIVSEIEGNWTLDIINSLLSSPNIPKDKLFKVYSNIMTQNPNIKIPLPLGFKYKIIKNQPTAYLILYKDISEENKQYNKIELYFKYENQKVPFYLENKIISLFENEIKIDIFRDLEYEKKTIERIKSFGFYSEQKKEDIIFIKIEENSQVSLNQWSNFLNYINTENTENWKIIYKDNFAMNFNKSNSILIQSIEKDNYFSLSFEIEIDNKKIQFLPLIVSILKDFNNVEELPKILNLELSENNFIQIETKKIETMLKTIFQLYDYKNIKKESLKVLRSESHLIHSLDKDVVWTGNKDILELSKKLRTFKKIQVVNPASNLKAKLRDYQLDGLSWLNFLYDFKFSGILADDMGLGKTLQSLAHLQRLKEKKLLNKPTLIILPTSLISNWKNEIKKFTPNLSYLSLYGADRFNDFNKISKYDIILTTYLLVIKDEKYLKKENFLYIILDEAQKIKNPKTKMAKSIKELNSDYRLALSGTPIENNLGELWSIFSFLMPGFLNTNSFFKKFYQTPIEINANTKKQSMLQNRIKPFMLRRTKENVVSELPPKTEIIKYAQFDSKQSQLYESIRVSMEKKVREVISSKGINRSQITILDALLKLRQICCHPKLLKLPEAAKIETSVKLDLLLSLVDQLILEKKKILIFSQFTSMLAIIEKEFKKRNIKYNILIGSTVKREETINQFTSGKSDIFLISLKAGGIGLNLVEADSIIHYDPWWNPAVENQATDRAHRIGQNKAIFVYKLIISNSIEEKILKLQESKKYLQNLLYKTNDNEKNNNIFNSKELIELLN